MLSADGDEGSREFIYQFDFGIDVTRALRENALFLEISLLSKKPEKSKVKPAAILPKSFRGSTKVLEKTTIKKLKSRKSNRLAYLRTEITDVIPNTSAKAIAAGKMIFRTPIKRSVTAILKQENYALPMANSLPRRKNVSLSKLSTPLISSQIDPAQLVSNRNSPPVMLSSLAPVVAMLAQKVMFRSPKKIAKPKLFTLFSKKATLKRSITLSEAVLKSKSKFYIYVRLRTNKGVVVSETGTWCNHSKILNDFLTPQIPPQLQVSQPRVGEMSVGITQIDPKATRIKLFRRIAPNEMSEGSGWELVCDQDLETGEGDIRFLDSIATSKPVMYRASCLGMNSRPAEMFSSRIITPRQEVKIDYSGKGSAIAKVLGTNIHIDTTDFPAGAITSTVRRYNLTLNSYADFQSQQASGYVTVGATADEQSQFITSPDDVISFSDNPQPGSTYKYVPVTYTLHGKEVIGQSAIIEYTSSPDDNPKVAMQVGAATLTSTRSSNSVGISLSGKFTDFGFEEIQSVLDSANQAGLFGGDISSQRAEFSSLITFLVERQNFKTGDVESFGTQEAGTFTDNITSQVEKNIKPLVAGTRYAYRVTACIRPAETLFPKLVVPETNSETLLTFTRQVQKFRGPLQLRKSTLASTARQANFSAPSALEPTDPMLAGKTSIQTTVDVVVPTSIVKGSSASVEKRMDHSLISWNFDGDTEKVDHFQVFLSSNGGFELLGTIHADFASTNFSYRHFMDETIMYDTSYSYEIKPISTAFKELSSIKTPLQSSTLFAGIPSAELRNIEVIER